MSDINPDKNTHWKNKLDNLEQLPGETFNKEAAWDKLHYRMQGKKGNKNSRWYWIAAACLLFALLFTWMNYPKNNSHLSNNETIIKPSEKTDISISTTSENNTKKNINVSSQANDKVASVINKPHPINHKAIPVETISVIHLNNPDSMQMNLETPRNILQTINTTPMTAMILPVKKKLKVVYINELGDQLIESPAMARNPDIRTFSVQLANGEVLSDPSVASTKTGLTILKAKPF